MALRSVPLERGFVRSDHLVLLSSSNRLLFLAVQRSATRFDSGLPPLAGIQAQGCFLLADRKRGGDPASGILCCVIASFFFRVVVAVGVVGVVGSAFANFSNHRSFSVDCHCYVPLTTTRNSSFFRQKKSTHTLRPTTRSCVV